MNRRAFYESLSDEVKTKIKACRSEEEMLKLLEEERIELSPDMLDGVAGGQGVCPYLYCDHCGCNCRKVDHGLL